MLKAKHNTNFHNLNGLFKEWLSDTKFRPKGMSRRRRWPSSGEGKSDTVYVFESVQLLSTTDSRFRGNVRKKIKNHYREFSNIVNQTGMSCSTIRIVFYRKNVLNFWNKNGSVFNFLDHEMNVLSMDSQKYVHCKVFRLAFGI